ncbi:MAG: hypothetical protein JXB15_06480 [Anaerolineales bacterium]|nr:hypothetical protein [Anaerolineales bacterium]
MSEQALQQSESQAWKPKALVIGAVLGALVGALAAYLYIQNTEEDSPHGVTAGEGVKLGVLVFGLLRSIASLGELKQ